MARAFFLGLFLCIGLACNEDRDPGHQRMDARVEPIVFTPPDAVVVTDTRANSDAPDSFCEAGLRACGTMCVGDLPNLPSNGCKYGCPGVTCAIPADAEGACTADGRCTFRCPPPFNLVNGQCACAPSTCIEQGFECGMQSDRCGGTLTCGTCNGQSCVSGRCGCSVDRYEPNNTQPTAVTRESLNDNDNRTVEVVGVNFHTDQDQDWFVYPITDGGFDGNPNLRVRLQQIPTGSNFDLVAYYLCTNGGNDSSCGSGTVDNTFGHGCASSRAGQVDEEVTIETSCNGTNTDSGVLYVKAFPRDRANSCANYRIEVRIQ